MVLMCHRTGSLNKGIIKVACDPTKINTRKKLHNKTNAFSPSAV